MSRAGLSDAELSGSARCPACDGAMRAWRTYPSSEPVLGPRSFVLARCSLCGTAVTLGEAVEEAHAAGAYGGGRPRGSRLVAPLLRAFDRERLARLPDPPLRLLDVGAGRGRFVATARAAGYDAMGLEPSLRAVDPALGLIPASIESASIAAESVDIVTLWHVLEHLEDPVGALATIRGWLAPGGRLLVGVPQLDSWQARIAGGRWYHLDLPRHRAHYTSTGLSELLSRSGFVVESSDSRLLEHNPYGMWQSWVSLGTRRVSYLYNLLKHNAPLWSGDLLITLCGLPLLGLAVGLEWLAGRAGRGGTVAVLARRAD